MDFDECADKPGGRCRRLGRFGRCEAVLLVEQNRGQDELLLAWEAGDDRRHLVGFDLALCDANMVLVHRIITGLFGFSVEMRSRSSAHRASPCS